MKKLTSTYSKFSVNGILSDKILIFDIDNTLLNSKAKIYILNNNNDIIETLDSENFNNYILPSNCHFDFREFSDLKVLLSSTLKPYFGVLVKEYFNGTHISILTARGSFSLIKKFFIQKGVDIKSDLIFTTGDPEYDYLGSVAEKKAFCIKKLINMGYKHLTFFDDDINNLKNVENTCKQFKDITIKTVHVK